MGATQSAAAAWGGVEILVPPEHSATTAGHCYVVGFTDAPVVEITLNGRFERAVAPKDSVFHVLLGFGYGLNEIVVTPISSDRVYTDADRDFVEILSGPDIDDKYNRLFTPYIFHGDQLPNRCLNCHRYTEGDSSMIESSEPCYDCHKAIKQRFKTHIPGNDRACANCHQIRADLRNSPTGTYTDANVCYRCHPDRISQFTQNYIHGPVAGGNCSICHDPHGSVYEKSLVTSVPALCPVCHDMKREQGLRIRHSPYEKGQCRACHDPHSTTYKWVLIKNSQELCISCHKDIGTSGSHAHPYNVRPKRKLATPLKLTNSGQLECVTCHDPHASNVEHLLRTTEESVCDGCHPDR